MGQSTPRPRGTHDEAALAGKPQASSAKSAQKRERIIRAATLIINEKSFALATMTEIAAALELRDATLYYYFPNKQAPARSPSTREIGFCAMASRAAVESTLMISLSL